MDLVQVLEKTVSFDKAELEAAQRFLEQAAQSDLVALLRQLSEILAHAGHSTVARMQAGLQLKNAVYSKDPNTRLFYQDRWLRFPPEHREYIKQNCVATLGTEQSGHSSAAQCVAYIACAELPGNHWPDLMHILVKNVIVPGSTELLKQATLETIGYICQDIDAHILSSQSNEILTAIVNGMKKEEASDDVRIAATTALLNSLEFTKENFDKENERNYIMQVTCEASQSANPQIKVAALQCLGKIMSLYYKYMECYMALALFPITLEAMRSDVDEVALQGVEFWSTVCDEEVDLSIEAAESAEKGLPPSVCSKHYAKGALQFLVPILVELLPKQDENDDEDEWNPAKAAGVCLMLLAQCCEDDVVPHILPFVKQHIKSPQWRYRDAACMAFGSILEGPERMTLKSLVEQAMPVIIELLRDPVAAVRDTAAWTVGRVCELLPEIVLSETFLEPLLRALVDGLNSEPRVATNVCWAIGSLAEAAYDAAVEAADQPNSGDKPVLVVTQTENGEPSTFALSKFYDPLVEKLLATTVRSDAGQHNLRNAAYAALMDLLKNSPHDCYFTVQKTTVVILERLEKVLSMENQVQSNSDRVQFNDLQSSLCGTLQSVLRKMEKADTPKIADQVMRTLLRMFETTVVNGGTETTSANTGGVQEDALLTMTALLDAIGEDFIKYSDVIRPILLACMRNVAEIEVCRNALGMFGDMCRTLNRHVLKWCEEGVFAILMEALTNHAVDKSLKPQVISVLGDLALAIGCDFRQYLDHVLITLSQAVKAEVDKTDPDMVDYLNDLRNSCLETYTGIVQGFKGDPAAGVPGDLTVIYSSVDVMIEALDKVAQDTITSEEVIASSCGLIGDLVSAFGEPLVQKLERDTVAEILTRGRRSKVNKTKALGMWATKEIRKIKHQQAAAVVAAQNPQQQQQQQQTPPPQTVAYSDGNDVHSSILPGPSGDS